MIHQAITSFLQDRSRSVDERNVFEAFKEYGEKEIGTVTTACVIVDNLGHKRGPNRRIDGWVFKMVAVLLFAVFVHLYLNLKGPETKNWYSKFV